MNLPANPPGNPPGNPEDLPRKRRYLVHLFCAHEGSNEGSRYTARIQLWAARIGVHGEAHERSFSDECELIEIVNPLLPPSSDVRDVLGLIESAEGFLYLLHLTVEQAGHLGWRE